jgi:hypothetical protein
MKLKDVILFQRKAIAFPHQQLHLCTARVEENKYISTVLVNW